MNEFLRHLLGLFSVLECSTSFSLPSLPPSPFPSLPSLPFSSKEVKVGKPDLLPSCFNEIRPMFKLFTRGVSEGLSDLSHIVVLIHGFDSRPAVWADELAKVVLAMDQREALGALTIDWQHGSR